ncbi:MAG: TIGR01244 family sulfur transferase [Halieaceae bacterium]
MTTLIKQVTDEFLVSGQISVEDLEHIAARGVRSLICNRPDGEANDQPNVTEIEVAAERHGLQLAYLPVVAGQLTPADIDKFLSCYERLPKPVQAYCRSGTRSITLWAMYQKRLGMPDSEILALASDQGYDLSEALGGKGPPASSERPSGSTHYDIVIVGGGAAGIAAASSLLKRTRKLSIAIIDPAEVHYYQPGWTLVGAGVFKQQQTVKTMASLIPTGAAWNKAAVGVFEPEQNRVLLEDSRSIYYDQLVVAPGIKLDWHAIEGLVDTLGQNGVTSNYRFDLAPYTWQLVSQLKRGRALFTQPPMPIKCAGAPQKAMYLSGDHWLRSGVLDDIEIRFHNAGAALFGVADYVPALMDYVERYKAQLNFGERLVQVDGPGKTAGFEVTDENGTTRLNEQSFDMMHVCPPQTAPDFVRQSPLADAAGWVDVDQNTLQHKRWSNIWGLGDAMNAPNAKTAAAARMQAPVVANNLLHSVGLADSLAHYNGYGSCPLTVERGKIVLAEFGYGGKLLPSFPRWIINGQKPSRLAWILKEKVLPPVYWQAMLKGKEWMVEPTGTENSRETA